MTLQQRAAALLRVVEEYRERECRTILERAHYEAARLEAHAHAEARQRVHQAVVAERRRARDTLRAAQAEVQTERRRHRQRRDLAVLELAWPELRAALGRRWAEPTARQRWVDGLVTEALRRIPGGPWTISHPPTWPAAERDAVATSLAAASGQPPTLVVVAEIDAGLRMTCGATTLDGTSDGLLADRATVGGRLLALLQADESDADSSPAAAGGSSGPLPLSPSHEGEGERGPTGREQTPSPLGGEGEPEQDEGDPQ
jgi:hypothetical protein